MVNNKTKIKYTKYYYTLKMINKDIQNYIKAYKVLLILCNQCHSLKGMPNMKSSYEVCSFSLQLFSVVKKKCKNLKLEFFLEKKIVKLIVSSVIKFVLPYKDSNQFFVHLFINAFLRFKKLQIHDEMS